MRWRSGAGVLVPMTRGPPGQHESASCTTAPTTTAATPRCSLVGTNALPSKRGGTRTVHGVAQLATTLAMPTAVRELPTAPQYEPGAAASEAVAAAVQASSADFLAGDLTQTLRRGAEVQRFGELAAQQETLTPAESDELYRYRL